jgi:hypothetical protein
MDQSSIATIYSTIISTVISTLVAVLVVYFSNKKEAKQRLLDKLYEINRLSIEYPKFEMAAFCNGYSSANSDIDENYSRYDSYCCIVFNLLEEMYLEFNGNETNMSQLIGYKEIIKLHKTWWMSPRMQGDNVDGYNSKFVTFIDRQHNVSSII